MSISESDTESYLDEEDDRISTVYVRNDGGYGVIQAENPIK